MPRFAVLRSKTDATPGDDMVSFKGHDIDPTLGQYGGFVFDTMVYKEAVGERPKSGQSSLLQKLQKGGRKIISHTVETDGIGQRQNVWTCEAEQNDAQAYAAIRDGWSWISIYNDAHLAQFRPQAAVLPDQAGAPAPTYTATVAPSVQPENLAYLNEVKAKARAIMAAGGKVVKLSHGRAFLEKYIKENESLLTVPDAVGAEAEVGADGENV